MSIKNTGGQNPCAVHFTFRTRTRHGRYRQNQKSSKYLYISWTLPVIISWSSFLLMKSNLIWQKGKLTFNQYLGVYENKPTLSPKIRNFVCKSLPYLWELSSWTATFWCFVVWRSCLLCTVLKLCFCKSWILSLIWPKKSVSTLTGDYSSMTSHNGLSQFTELLILRIVYFHSFLSHTFENIAN